MLLSLHNCITLSGRDSHMHCYFHWFKERWWRYLYNPRCGRRNGTCSKTKWVQAKQYSRYRRCVSLNCTNSQGKAVLWDCYKCPWSGMLQMLTNLKINCYRRDQELHRENHSGNWWWRKWCGHDINCSYRCWYCRERR